MYDFHRLLHDLTHEVDAGRLADSEASARVAEYIQRELRCAHVTFWDVFGDVGQRKMRRGVAYDGTTGTVVANSIELAEAGGGYFDCLLRTGCYVSGDTFADPNLAGVRDVVLTPYNIHALLSASYGSDGKTMGILTCTDSVRREWKPTEVTALRRCAAELARQRARRAQRVD
jgi:GAF domain-containing protein